jgi:hypothetical protein
MKGGSSAPPMKLPSAEATTEAAPQRHILPKDLPNAIKHLSDGELEFLHATTLNEMKRRGRMPPGVETDLQSLRHRFDFPPNSSPSYMDCARGGVFGAPSFIVEGEFFWGREHLAEVREKLVPFARYNSVRATRSC